MIESKNKFSQGFSWHALTLNMFLVFFLPTGGSGNELRTQHWQTTTEDAILRYMFTHPIQL